MDNDIKSEKYRKLSVAALVMGIIGLGSIVLYNILWMPISIFLSKFMEENITPATIIPFIALVLGLSIAAVICGSIDLSRIKKGLYNNKGKGFDIAGIVLGGIVVLIAIIFMLGELIFPH
jgi:tellurite resistance protein TehA-like permease